jgi:Tfp pilus assembly protein PilO
MKSLFSLFIVIVCSIAYFLLIAPKIDAIQGLRATLNKYNTTVNESKELQVTLNGMFSSLNAISDTDQTRLNRAVPKQFNNILFVSELNNIAFKNAVSIKSIQIDEKILEGSDVVVQTGAGDLYRTVSAKITVAGPYDQFIKFLKDIESSLRIMDVRTISIKAIERQAGAVSYEYTLEIETYHLR